MNLVTHTHRIAWMLTAGWILAAGPAVSAPAELETVTNHAFDVDVASATACRDGVIFDGVATGASALNLLMTSQVFNQLGTTLVATGNTHTFTSVGERFTFSAAYPATTFPVGGAVGLSVSDTPPSLQGTQGDFANSVRVADCSIATVPALPAWGFAVFALILAAGGATMVASGRRFGRPLELGRRAQ